MASGDISQAEYRVHRYQAKREVCTRWTMTWDWVQIKRALKREADQKSSGFHTNMKVIIHKKRNGKDYSMIIQIWMWQTISQLFPFCWLQSATDHLRKLFNFTRWQVFLFSLLVAAACAQRGAFLQELINGDLWEFSSRFISFLRFFKDHNWRCQIAS